MKKMIMIQQVVMIRHYRIRVVHKHQLDLLTIVINKATQSFGKKSGCQIVLCVNERRKFE